MADTYKVLGQVAGTTAWQVLYDATSSVSVSTVNVINAGVSNTATYTLAAVPASEYTVGMTPLNKHVIVKSKTIAAGEHHGFTGGITLSAGDYLLFSSSANVIASVYGVEIS